MELNKKFNYLLFALKSRNRNFYLTMKMTRKMNLSKSKRKKKFNKVLKIVFGNLIQNKRLQRERSYEKDLPIRQLEKALQDRIVSHIEITKSKPHQSINLNLSINPNHKMNMKTNLSIKISMSLCQNHLLLRKRE